MTEPDIQGTIEGWNQGQKTCRGRQTHRWSPFNVVIHRTGAALYEVIEQCGYCRNRRTRHMNGFGYWLDTWQITYRPGYLMPKGAGRIASDLQAVLRLEEIENRPRKEAPDDGG